MLNKASPVLLGGAMPFYSPLRYPGGKRKLAGLLKAVFEANGLCDGTYVEPYAGGAAVALSLLLDHYAWRVVINDADPNVFAFWWAVLNDTEGLLRLIHDTPVDMDQWHRQKQVLKSDMLDSRLERGFAAFFMNRTNRSGIIGGGVIGGQDQTGKYKIDARFNKLDLCRRIELIAQYKNRIDIHGLDALELMSRIVPTLPGKSLVYFDPPYYVKGRDLYANYYCHEDHIKIARTVRSLRVPWIVTYDDVPAIREMYTGERFAEFSLTYTAHEKRPRGAEVMFYRLNVLPEDWVGTTNGVYWY